MGQITEGLAGFNCENICAGGIKRVWLTNRDDIATITYGGDDEVTAITMAGVAPNVKKFFEIKLKTNTKQLIEQFNVTEDGCGITLTQTFTGIAPCFDQDTRVFMQQVSKQSCCGMAVIHEENSGFVAIWGLIDDLPVRLGAGTQTDTGANLTDPNQVTLELVCQTIVDGQKTEFVPGVVGIPI